MRLSPEMLTFIHAPDTVDFVTRATDAFFDYAHSSDEVVVGQLLSGRYVLGYVKAENFHRLEEALGAAFVSSASVVLGLLDRPALEASGVSQVHSQPYLSLKGRGVLLGFVDTGIDYTQDIFRYADGSSRIQYIYDQTAEGDPPPASSWAGSTARRSSTRPWPRRTPTPWCRRGTSRATAPFWPRWPPGSRRRTSPAWPRMRRSSP